jgi:CubicO group peptidase (beta-lactamase class C family)
LPVRETLNNFGAAFVGEKVNKITFNTNAMRNAIAVLIVILLLSSVYVPAQANDRAAQKDFEKAFDAFVRKTLEKLPDIPGVAVVVVKDDRPIFVHAYGMADKESGKAADTDTLFYIASSTKSFTALAASLLDREGKIKLSDPITKYSSGIELRSPLPDKITIRDLVTHTSGLKNDALTFRMAYSGETDAGEMAKVFGEATTYSDASYGKYRYDNLGYNIYGVLLQNHMKKKWQDLLQEKIFDPLGMKHTTAYISKAEAKKWTVASPYYFNTQYGKTARSPLGKNDNNMQSAGGLFVSISDMGKWLNVNLNDGKLNGKQIIPAEVMRSVHTGYTRTTRDMPPFTGEGEYGLGWQIGKYKNEKVIYHHGGFPGYSSHVSFLPDKRIAVAVLTNEGFVGARVGNMLATYAYDWWLKSENLEADYAQQLQDVVSGYGNAKKQMMAAFADRAKRTSQLTRPLSEYTGRYRSEQFGTIEVTSSGNDLAVKMGNIKVVSTPFTAKDTIRVEMMPGQGEVIRFNKNAEEKFDSLTYAGATFKKIPANSP